jgi:hypothetical protein
MGVLPEYRWLKSSEIIERVNDQKTYKLEPGKTYWINPGGRGPNIIGRPGYANFAVYSPKEQTVTLFSKEFERKRRYPDSLY